MYQRAFFSHVFRGGLMLALTLLGGSVWAQNEGQEGENDNNFRISGTIKAIAPGYLQVEVSEEELWVVQVLPITRTMRFTGSAEPDWLMPGMWVNFTTQFNAKGQAVEPVKLLSVFTPGASRGRDVPAYEPGIKSLTNPGAGISFSGEEKVKPKTDTAPYEVTGQLKGITKAGLTVLAGSAAIQVPLTEDATISVDVADLRPMRVGDKAEIYGRKVEEKKGIAFRVEVKGAAPLSSKQAPATEVKTKPSETEPKSTTVAAPTTTTSPSTTSTPGKKKLPLLGQKP